MGDFQYHEGEDTNNFALYSPEVVKLSIPLYYDQRRAPFLRSGTVLRCELATCVTNVIVPSVPTVAPSPARRAKQHHLEVMSRMVAR